VAQRATVLLLAHPEVQIGQQSGVFGEALFWVTPSPKSLYEGGNTPT